MDTSKKLIVAISSIILCGSFNVYAVAEEAPSDGEESLANFAKKLAETPPEEMAKQIEKENASNPLKAASQMDWIARGYADMADMNRSTMTVYQDYRSKAEFMYKRAMALRETQGSEHPDVAISLGHLAMLYFRERKVESEALVKRLLSINEERFPLSSELAWTLHNLANWHQEEGNSSEAEGLLLRELAIQEKAYSTKTEVSSDMDMAIAMNSLIKLYKVDGRYKDAVAVYTRWEKVVGIPFKTSDPYGPGLDPMELAELYGLLGKYEEAEALYLKSLAETEKQFVRNQKVVADALTRVGNFYASQEKAEAAAPLYQRALSIWKQELVEKEERRGPAHPDVVEPLLKLADIHRRKGQEAEAAPLYERALQIRLGEINWRSLNTLDLRAVPPLLELANIYTNQGKDEEVKRLHDKLVELLEWNARVNEAMYGRESPDVVKQALKHNAAQLREVGRIREAEAMEARAAAIEVQVKNSH